MTMSRTGLVIPTLCSFPLADIDNLQWTRFLNPQGYAIYSGAINPVQPRLMAVNQPESTIEQRHLPPPIPKNRRKFLRSHLCAQIMFIERETCSLSVKRAHLAGKVLIE